MRMRWVFLASLIVRKLSLDVLQFGLLLDLLLLVILHKSPGHQDLVHLSLLHLDQVSILLLDAVQN